MVPSRKLLSLIGLVVTAAIAVPVLPLDFPLTSTAIRDAYFIGSRNDEQTADFLAQYTRRFKPPKNGAYVEEIGMDTPFTEIVRHAQGKANYYAPDAVEEFQHKKMSVCVHVDIQLTPSYSPVPAPLSASHYQWVPDFWNDFKVRAVQDKKEIPAQRIRGGPLFFYGDIGNTPVVTGAKIQLEYDPQKISAAPLDINVLTPDGQEVETTFDLVKLR